MGIFFDKSYTYEIEATLDQLRSKINAINYKHWFETNTNLYSRISTNDFVIYPKLSFMMPQILGTTPHAAIIEGSLKPMDQKIVMKVNVRPSYLMVGSFYLIIAIIIFMILNSFLRGELNPNDIGIATTLIVLAFFSLVSMIFSTRRLLKRFESYLGLEFDL